MPNRTCNTRVWELCFTHAPWWCPFTNAVPTKYTTSLDHNTLSFRSSKEASRLMAIKIQNIPFSYIRTCARQPNNSTKIYIWRKLHKPLQPKWTLNSMNWCGRPDMHWRRAKLASGFISHWRFRGRIVAREEKCVQLRKQETLLAIPIQGTAFLYGLRVIVVQTQPQQKQVTKYTWNIYIITNTEARALL